MKLEERLIQLRTENSLSQSDLAERMHVSRQTISRWETGRPSPLQRTCGISVNSMGYLWIRCSTVSRQRQRSQRSTRLSLWDPRLKPPHPPGAAAGASWQPCWQLYW